ncbi:hypothetical protein M3Y99_01032300 [Aphelenchoides fujianensis]|nr:hypothetical protein M3Y99_01194000 [Aphelenchoides fujianensis]KAI6230710.1 hypothetical protein M3Y99_01032300 [Aphelenchoides fujianensis]
MLRPLIALLISFNLVASNLLSCRIIWSVCQEDGACLEEMHLRFPHCLHEAMKRSWDGVADKRGNSPRLLRILTNIDRIPTG